MKLMSNTSTSSTLMTKEADLLSPPPRGSIRRSSVATGDIPDARENSAKEPNIHLKEPLFLFWEAVDMDVRMCWRIPDEGGGPPLEVSFHCLINIYFHCTTDTFSANGRRIFKPFLITWFDITDHWAGIFRYLCCQDCTGHGEMFHLRRLGKSDWCRLRTSCWLSSSSAVLLYCPLLLSSPVLYCCLSSSSAPEAAFPHFIFRLHSPLVSGCSLSWQKRNF